jgi:hypothetical protein
VGFSSVTGASKYIVPSVRGGTSLPSSSQMWVIVVRLRPTDPLCVSHSGDRMLWKPLPSVPGTFAWWVAERYLLHSIHRGTLHTGQVHHKPYCLTDATVDFSKFDAEFPLSDVHDIPPPSVLYSPGVDVDVFELKPFSSVAHD